MNGAAKSGIVVALTALVTLIATQGAAFVESLGAFWLFVLKLTDDAPLGLSSFLLAFSLAVASQPFLRRWVPALKCPLSRDFIIESAALAIAVAVMWTQMRTLPGIMLGMFSGFVAPYAHKGLGALWGLAVVGLRRALGAPES